MAIEKSTALSSQISARFLLERVLLYLSQSVPQAICLHDANLQIRETAYAADNLAMTLSGWMVGNKFPERSEYEVFEYPDGWWQSLKSEHAPRWFLRRWPVKMKEFRYESARYRYHICPHWNEQFAKDKTPHILYLRYPLSPENYHGR